MQRNERYGATFAVPNYGTSVMRTDSFPPPTLVPSIVDYAHSPPSTAPSFGILDFRSLPPIAEHPEWKNFNTFIHIDNQLVEVQTKDPMRR